MSVWEADAIDLVERDLGLLLQRLDVLQRLLVRDELHVVLARRAQHSEYEVHLLDVVVAGEERLAAVQLGQYAAHAPHVYLVVVLLAAAHHLGRAVPARHDVLGELVVGLFFGAAGEAEVADLEVAVGVEEEVGRLQVAVDDVGGVDVFQAWQSRARRKGSRVSIVSDRSSKQQQARAVEAVEQQPMKRAHAMRNTRVQLRWAIGSRHHIDEQWNSYDLNRGSDDEAETPAQTLLPHSFNRVVTRRMEQATRGVRVEASLSLLPLRIW